MPRDILSLPETLAFAERVRRPRQAEFAAVRGVAGLGPLGWAVIVARIILILIETFGPSLTPGDAREMAARIRRPGLNPAAWLRRLRVIRRVREAESSAPALIQVDGEFDGRLVDAVCEELGRTDLASVRTLIDEAHA